MTRSRVLASALGLLVTGAIAVPVGAADLPDWARSMVITVVPDSVARGAPAVVLEDVSEIVVPAQGRILERRRLAVRILKKPGVKQANAAVVYNAKSGKVRRLEAWLIHDGEVIESHGSGQASDLSLAQGKLTSESRMRYLEAENADVGDVWAYEWEREDEPLILQWAWRPQREIPVLFARFVVDAKKGETVVGRWFHRDPVPAVESGTLRTWELTALPAVKDEALAPDARAFAPWLAVDVQRPGVTWSDWESLAKWCGNFLQPAVAATPAVKERSLALTKDASADAWSRAVAVTRFVQRVNYVAIELGLDRGGGYTPRAPETVLTEGWGDCKDKSTLCRALLEASGVPTAALLISGDDPEAVDANWPAPGQFNHCIVAVRVDGAECDAAFDLPGNGRWVAFDPTSPTVPFGRLPGVEAGANALFVSSNVGRLVRMPSPVARVERVRTVESTLAESGALAFAVCETYSGSASDDWRDAARGLELPAAYRRALDRRMSEAFGSVRLDSAHCRWDSSAHVARLEFSAVAPAYGARGGRTLVFRPAAVPLSLPSLGEEKARTTPFRLQAAARTDTTVIALPAGFRIDELPTDAKENADFGTYSCVVRGEPGRVVVARSLTIHGGTWPAARAADARAFFDRVGGLDDRRAVAIAAN